MRFGLAEATIDSVNKVFSNYNEIEEVLVYGSRAKGNYREGSDVDLTLIGLEITNEVLSKVCQDIDDLNTPYFYDISLYHKLNSKNLIDHIKQVGQRFYIQES
jgi:predicted nucleotidyltransferase